MPILLTECRSLALFSQNVHLDCHADAASYLEEAGQSDPLMADFPPQKDSP
ncbi:UNVERIFIED_CONTAM: hypothetical protein Slati_0859000 [Sesamum latifolium]|uniref:Uncharacterized protein n=1 Tax=Sesamum latifolium TaxID=2727402 RepID=A0AAW2XNN1_9LAMI